MRHLVLVMLVDKYSCFSWWWAYSRPKHVEKRNTHTKKNLHQVGFIYKIKLVDQPTNQPAN